MMNLTTRAVAAAVALSATPMAAIADNAAELAELREQIEALREDYAARLRELETRLEQAEALARDAGHDAIGGTAVARAPGTARGNAFNPALSVSLQGAVHSYSRDPGDYALPGFASGPESGLAPEGFSLDETEITASANADHLFYAETTLGLHEDEAGTEVEIEQAFVEPLQLPAGLGGRFGRFYSSAGYLNGFHSHAWDFSDAPLAYRAFLGEQYRDDGVRLTWTLPSALYLVAGGEMLAGNRFPAGESRSVTGDVRTLFAKLGGDAGVNHAWQAGVSGLFANAHERDSADSHHGSDAASTAFSGDSDLLVAELLWKWAPGGNPRRTHLVLQGEYFHREESGALSFVEDGDAALLDYDGDQQGWYAQAVYQFMPRWRLGLRYDWLQSDNRLRVLDAGGFADPDEIVRESGYEDADGNPQRWSLMLDWTPSEFSRIRAQYNRDESLPGVIDNQWALHYIINLGSHAAHQF